MRARKSRRDRGVGAPVERMEDRVLLSAVLANGTTNGMAYDASGRLWVAYYDSSEHNLKYALKNADGTWATPANNVIDASSADVGQMVSLVIERGGLPGVAYMDAVNADLKYAHFNGTTWDVSVVESYRITGYYPSIAFNPNTNRPAISYYYKTGGDLRLRQFNGSNWGGDADYQLIDGQAEDVGRYGALALDRSGRWAVVYDDTTNGAAKYAYQGTGGVWTTRMVDNLPTSDVAYMSLAFDSSNRPALAYYDTYAADLKFAKGSDANGTGWTVQALAVKNTAGKYTNLFYDGPTDKFTVYYNYEAGSLTKINSVSGNTGGWADAQTLYTGGGSESRILKTPGTTNGVTFSWSGANVDGSPGNSLFVNDTTTGTVWRRETADAGFGGRISYAGSAVHTYNGQQTMYSIGGQADDGALGAVNLANITNLVRSSTDGGVTWTYRSPVKADGTAAFGVRMNAAAVSFLGKLWVIGGTYWGALNDVWSSADGGATWAREADLPAEFGGGRYGMASAVSADGGTLYLVGGENAAGRNADVWATTDGQTWTRKTASAAFGGVSDAAAVWFNNRLWVSGGVNHYDGNVRDSVWSSADGGVTWTEASATAGAAKFAARSGHGMVVHDNRMWVLGGAGSNTTSSGDHNDAYYSFDGINWTLAATGQQFERDGAFAGEVNGRLVFGFGLTMTTVNGIMSDDVWSTT